VICDTIETYRNTKGNIMSKQFKIVTQSDEVQEFTAKQYIDAYYAAIRWVDVYGNDGCASHGVHTFLKDVEVPMTEYIEACESGFDVWYEKKLITHKKIRVLHGSSVGCYVYIWVKR
jgi:hypothetical protein